jgi:hypothetical protein
MARRFSPSAFAGPGVRLWSSKPPRLERRLSVIAGAAGRRRDNLTGVLHMIVEALFWFHPLTWWLGARLMEERERACDEEVLRLGNQPEDYAEGILNICDLYCQLPLR